MRIDIAHGDLIDALEKYLGGIWENIKEGDKITRIEVGSRSIIIIIGEED